MGEIYSRADVVIAWLGAEEPEERSLAAMAVVATRWRSLDGTHAEIMRYYDLAASFDYKDGEKFSKTFHAFWSRAWIVQEMALASRVKLLAGRTEWDISMAPSIRDLNNARNRVLLWDAVFDKFLKTAARPHESDGADLIGLLNRFRDKQCSEPRDRIFSLLSLCSEDSRIDVDYNTPEVRLMCRVLGTSVISPCLCCVAVLVYALNLTSLLNERVRDVPLLREDFAEFQARGFTLSSPTPTGHSTSKRWPERCSGCTEALSSQWKQDGIVMFCLSRVCSDTPGHIFWSQPGYSNYQGSALLANCVYIDTQFFQGDSFSRPLGEMGEHVTITHPADGDKYTVRLRLGALLDIFFQRPPSAKAPTLCNPHLRTHGCRLINTTMEK